jgi:hypothetical protein
MPFSLRSSFASVAVLFAAVNVSGQSLKPRDPGHLAPGVNRALVDSFVGDHYWDFWVNPGSFKLVFAGSSPEEGFSVGGRPQVGADFIPKTPGAVIIQRALPNGGVVFTGTVKQRTHVGIVVEPVKSALVRQSTPYTLVATGSVDYGGAGAGGAASGPSVVGVYSPSGWGGQYGVIKLLPDGQIVTSNGQHGTWQLFDADSRIYVLTIAGDRKSLVFQPGRGFADANNNNIALEAKH